MPEKTIDELRDLIGTSVRATSDMSIEGGKVEEYARAVRNDDPIHRSASAAADRGYDAVPAPLSFTWTAQFPRYRPDGEESFLPLDLGFRPEDIVHGEQHYEFTRPVYVGDVLSSEVELVDVYQREGSRGGSMTFAVLETEFRDGNGSHVVTERRTVIEAGGGPDSEAGE